MQHAILSTHFLTNFALCLKASKAVLKSKHDESVLDEAVRVDSEPTSHVRTSFETGHENETNDKDKLESIQVVVPPSRVDDILVDTVRTNTACSNASIVDAARTGTNLIDDTVLQDTRPMQEDDKGEQLESIQVVVPPSRVHDVLVDTIRTNTACSNASIVDAAHTGTNLQEDDEGGKNSLDENSPDEK